MGQIPAGFSGDEAITGYSAYSVLKTARDEWGDFLPVTFRSFGDYKPGLYTYLTVPSIAIFGLNEFAVRLPMAVVGVLAVITIYFLAQQLFKNFAISALAALVLALSPWHIHFSRTAFEGGLTTLLFPAGLLFYLKSLKNSRFLPLAVVFWGLNLFSYLPARLFTVLAGFAIVLWRRPKNLTFNPKTLTGIVILITLILLFFSSRPQSLNRFYDISIFSESLEPLKQTQFESHLPRNITRVFDNKVTFYFSKFFENYLSYFSPHFLFTGNRPSFSYLNLPGAPLLYGIEIIFFIAAFVFAIKKPGTFPLILLAWLILAPIPAALTQVGQNANRAITFLPVFSLISAFGAVNLIEFLRSKYKVNLTPIFVIIILAASAHFLQNYFFHLPAKPAESLRYGYREAIAFTESVKDDYERIIFTKANSEPQAFVAFYTKYDPVLHQQEAQDWLKFEQEGKKYLDQLAEYGLGKYEFRDTNWNDVKNLENAFIVAAPKDIPEGVQPLKNIKDLAGREIFKIVESLKAVSTVEFSKKVLSTNTQNQTSEEETEITPQEVLEQTSQEIITQEVTRVLEVIDGDTVRLETGESVRYIGIDSPERGKCFYFEAKKANKELVEGKEVVLVKDITEKDRFGRLLRYVFLDGQLVNEVLIAGGFAKSYYYPPDLAYYEKFAQTQNQAKEQNLGLWGGCS